VVVVPNPPAISTWPLGSSVAVAEARATVIGGLDVLEVDGAALTIAPLIAASEASSRSGVTGGV